MLVNKTIYIRDKRSPIPKNENVSKVMSSNKARDTGPEIVLRKSLWKSGIRGFRLHSKNIVGRPDISFIRRKLAVFVHGCFWHRCPYCKMKMPKNNVNFWQEKFEKNKTRDKKKNKELKKLGWKILIIWECQIQKNIETQIEKIQKLYKN